jgi:CubicO group peptidase (beta-lactamase class C family)
MPLKKKFLLLFYSLFLGAISKGQFITRLDNSKISEAEIDTKISRLMTAANVQGMAITIFNNNEPVYEKAFGFKRIDTKDPLKSNTNIYGASLSKPLFAVLVMKLVEEQVLVLDKPLETYLSNPIYEYKPSKKWHDNYQDLKSDSLYKQITARMCLDHTTGFPNWRWDEPDQKLRVRFKPGSAIVIRAKAWYTCR